MRVQVAALLCMVVVVVSSPQPQHNPKRPSQTILKLREPLTSLSLEELYANMENENTVTFYTNCVTGEVTKCGSVGNALKVLLNEIIPGQDLCYGCTVSEKERVQYVLDVLKEKYPAHACKILAALGDTAIFPGGNPAC